MVLLPERDCAVCTSQQKKIWGCTEPSRQPLELDGELHFRCPRRPLLEEPQKWGRVFWLYRQFDRGMLPEEGALLSQPHKLMRYFEILEVSKSNAEAEQQKQERRKHGQQARFDAMMSKRT
jgi:hypothetical protein